MSFINGKDHKSLRVPGIGSSLLISRTTSTFISKKQPYSFLVCALPSPSGISKMQIWLPLSVVTCLVALLSANMDESYPSKHPGTSRPINKLGSKNPMELNINFTFPANGLPPLKLNLGNVAAFLTDRDAQGKPLGLASNGKAIKKTVLVTIKNPNKPQVPIPAGIFTAALPQGFQIPVNPLQVCRDLIVSKCRDVCSVTQSLCRSTCDGRKDCVNVCRATQSSCTKFCNTTFSGAEANTTKGNGQEMMTVLLPKCLKNCRYNYTCVSGCHDVCHAKLLAPPPLTDVLKTIPVSLPIAGLPVNDFGIKSEQKDEGKERTV